MEIWLDTIDLEAVRKGIRTGILHGVTTNPSILGKASDPVGAIQALLGAQRGPVTVQVVDATADGMVEQGRRIHEHSSRIIVKIPATEEGYEAIHRLADEGITVMATVIFHPNQALISAMAGASYVAPYFSRMQKSGDNPLTQIDAMMQMMQRYDLKTKIIAASLRTSEQVFACAQLGFDAVTLREDLFDDFVSTPELASFAVEQFATDWSGKENSF